MSYGTTGAGQGNQIPKGYQQGRMQQFTPEQMQLLQSMIGRVGPDSFLSKIASGDEEAFQQMEAPAHRQFAGMQGNMASRFSGMGMGATKSSGFQNTMNQASSNFAQDLQSKRMDLQSQATRDLMDMSNNLLQQRPYDNFLTKKDRKPSFLEQIFGNGIFGNDGKNLENVLKIMGMFV